MRHCFICGRLIYNINRPLSNMTSPVVSSTISPVSDMISQVSKETTSVPTTISPVSDLISQVSKETTSVPTMTSPVGRIGLIADVQYVDVDDCFDFTGRQRRRHRNSLNVLRSAVSAWNLAKVDAIVQLGDLVDVKARDQGTSKQAWDSCMKELDRAECGQLVHLIGNHELYNFRRKQLLEMVNGATRDQAWHSFKPLGPASQLRLVVLDSYDFSTIEGSSEQQTEAALAFLSGHNPNDITKFGVDWSKGLTGLSKRFMPYNGGLGVDQVAWLERTLEAAEEAGEHCVLLSHVPLWGCDPVCHLWNYEEVLGVIRQRGPGVVVAVIAGHDHEGGYTEYEGVHHLTLPSPLLCGEGEGAWGVMEVFRDRVEFRWEGERMIKHLVMKF